MFKISTSICEHIMRQPRLTLEPEACAFHCLARTIDQNWYFDTPKRRDQIVRIIQASEILYGANLLNFVVMSNHIHLLAQMRTESSREPLTKSTLLKVSRVLYSRAYVTDLKQEFKRAEKSTARLEISGIHKTFSTDMRNDGDVCLHL